MGERMQAFVAAMAAKPADDVAALQKTIEEQRQTIVALTEVVAQGETLIEERDARIGDLAAALLEAERRASVAERRADGLEVALAEIARAREEAGRG